jgi:isopentenyl diphosphate isomerase/L-lactate dehydrogenase-like FMN-dependent dehydrogenase
MEPSPFRNDINIEDVRRAARRRLPRFVFDYIDGGAEDERTVQANLSAFADIALRPQSIVELEPVDLATTILGHRLQIPVILAPTGTARLAHHTADFAGARAAARFGTVMIVSTASTISLEQVAQATSGPKWFQLYVHPDEGVTRSMIERVARADYAALVCTVDTPVIGRRERDSRNGLALPFKPRIGMILDVALHPRWLGGWIRGGRFSLGNVAPREHWWESGATDFFTIMANPRVTEQTLRRIRDLWDGHLVVKGILTPEDANRAFHCGADALIVSNHGGRQLDGVRASVHTLPRVITAVDDKIPVLLDGGIRRGADVIKALALGAKAVLIGRPWLWGAARGGEMGVFRVLELLEHELTIGLTLLGRGVARLDTTCIEPMHPRDPPWWIRET